MIWAVLFGGIGVVALAVFVPLGLWVWRQARALTTEAEAVAQMFESAVPKGKAGDRG